MLLDTSVIHVMKMTIVKIIDVSVVENASVSTAWAVLVIVVGMIRHRSLLVLGYPFLANEHSLS